MDASKSKPISHLGIRRMFDKGRRTEDTDGVLVAAAQDAAPESAFVASVAEQFEERGRLSDKQREALRRLMEEHEEDETLLIDAEHARPRSGDFLDSMRAWLDERGNFTDAQRSVLRRIADGD